MIKALRVLDPSDLLLNHVAGPVRRYLKQRKDAVRLNSIVHAFSHEYHLYLVESKYIHSALNILFVLRAWV